MEQWKINRLVFFSVLFFLCLCLRHNYRFLFRFSLLLPSNCVRFCVYFFVSVALCQERDDEIERKESLSGCIGG